MAHLRRVLWWGAPQTPAPRLPAPFSSPTCSTHASCFAPEIRRPCLTWAVCPAPPSPGVGSVEPPRPPGRPLPALGAAVWLLARVSSSLSLAGRSPGEAEGTGLGRASQVPSPAGGPTQALATGHIPSRGPPQQESRSGSALHLAGLPQGRGPCPRGPRGGASGCSRLWGGVPCIRPGPEALPLSCWPVTGSPDFRPLGICEKKDPALGLYWDGGHGIKPRLVRAGPSSASPCGLLRGACLGEGGGRSPLSNHN